MKNKDTKYLIGFLVFAVLLAALAIQNKEARYIQKNIECYQLTKDGDIQITLKNGSGYYFNIYKDVKFKIVNRLDDKYLYINNNLMIELIDSDVDKIDITGINNYKDYKQSFISVNGYDTWELAKQEINVKNELQSYVYYLINRI